MFAQLSFIAEENLIIHTNIVFITQTSHTTLSGQSGQENCLLTLLILMIISSEEITTGQEYNEYLGEFQMENYNLEDNQSVRSNLSLIQVAATPTFATGNWIIMTGSLMENIKHPVWCQAGSRHQTNRKILSEILWSWSFSHGPAHVIQPGVWLSLIDQKAWGDENCKS